MGKKLKVGVLFGGKSAEHEISIQSAKNVIQALDSNKFEVVPIGIDKKGEWHFLTYQEFLKLFQTSALIPFDNFPNPSKAILSSNHFQKKIDVIFPILHGPFGEDGTVQGLLKLLDIPFVGAGVLGSAAAMDKVVMKRLFKEASLPTPSFLSLRSHETITFEEVETKLGFPFFVKPANLGSSVGISKVKKKEDFSTAIAKAFLYDHKIIIEEAIMGREIECSVLGNESPISSLPGEIIPTHEFYSYEAKYLDENGARFEIPANLPSALIQQIQNLAKKAFQAVCCEGMARVDFFLEEERGVFLNEINTIPGFTRISLYPKLWEVSGISYNDLIEKLINLALERHCKDKKLKISYS